MKQLVNYNDFDKLDLRVGKVMEATRKEGSEKLLRLVVDFGDEGTRVILSGIYPFYTPETLLNKSFVFILNLEPRKIMGEESQGMILATDGDPVLFTSLTEVAPGIKLR